MPGGGAGSESRTLELVAAAIPGGARTLGGLCEAASCSNVGGSVSDAWTFMRF